MRQVEYAIEAIKLGSTAVGIQTTEGIVLAVEKRITSPLLVRTAPPRTSLARAPRRPLLFSLFPPRVTVWRVRVRGAGR